MSFGGLLVFRSVVSDSALTWYIIYMIELIDCFLVLNATFRNISAILWLAVLVMEQTGVPGENHRPWGSNW